METDNLELPSMSVAVFGASGQLGDELIRCLPEGTCFSKNRDTLDVTDYDAVSMFIKTVRPKFLINCAATNHHRDWYLPLAKHQAVNTLAVSHIAKACAIFGVNLIHLSDASVFGGRDDKPFHEHDPLCPLQEDGYSISKALGEQAILSVASGTDGLNAATPFKYWIIRTATILSTRGRNSFIDTLLHAGLSTRTVRAPQYLARSITYAPHLAQQIMWLLEHSDQVPRGVYHIANRGYATIYEIAQQFFRYAPEFKISSSAIVDLPKEDLLDHYPSAEVRNVTVSCQVWEEVTGNKLPFWSTAVNEYAKAFYHHYRHN